MWDSKGYNNGDRFMEIGNAGAYHRQERSWWAQGSGSAQTMRRWRQCIQNCHDEPQASMPATVKISNSEIQLHLKDHLSPHVHCQYCESETKPLVVVTPVKGKQRRKTTCFCTDCWQFTCKHTGRDKVTDMSFLKNMDVTTGKLLKALPYAEEEHPRRL